ncbi:hypothetical protein KDRO_D06610 [Kluyveromyces lactis]|nr:hypothetical protein KDRO_D06610 [Kluyveromyces lactis]
MSEYSFAGKIALVTGASTGVGEGIARALYERGATVVITSRHMSEVQETADNIDPSGSRVIGKEVDVTVAKAVEDLIQEIREEFGALHHLVNNAGITGPHQTGIEDYDINSWRQVIDTNINGTFYTLKYALPLMENSSSPDSEATVVNISAVNGLVGIPGISPYTATKHAVIGITQSVALEFAERNVRVNAVAPGYVSTPKIQALPEETQQWMSSQHPMKRMATMTEVANTVLFLLSPLTGFTTGSVYPIDGGFLAQ